MGKLTAVGPSERAGFNHIYSTYETVGAVATYETLWALLA